MNFCAGLPRLARPPEIGHISGCFGSFVTSPEILRAQL